MAAPANTLDARGLSFACLPGCGFCCTVSPLVAQHEARGLGALVTRSPEGDLRIPVRGVACSALGADRTCGSYEARPLVCRLYPYHVHAGRRVQVTVSLACPGVGPSGEPAEEGAARAAAMALAQPGSADMAVRAKATFAEFDRRMKEWGVAATPDQLRAAFLPHLDRLARPHLLPAYFAGLGEGDLLLGKDPARAVSALFDAVPEDELADLVAAAAREGLDHPGAVQWVEADFSWAIPRIADKGIATLRVHGDQRRETTVAIDALPLVATEEATGLVAAYLARLCHRDRTEGSAAWLVDASGYQVTPAAAYARVLGEASFQVALRAGLFAAEEGAEVVEDAHARRAVAAYETAYHSLPTLGSVL